MSKASVSFVLLKSVAGVVAMAVLVAWSAGCFQTKVPPGEVSAPAGRPVPADAPTVTLATEEIAPRIDVVGTAVSANKINLSARIPAYVKEVFVSAGDPVKRDQVLLTLDDRELRQQLAAAEAQRQQAQTEYERMRQLVAANAASDQAMTAAQAAFDGAQAQADQIKVMLTYAEIRAPIDGKVTDRRIEAGDLANPGQFLLAVYDPANMRLEAPTPLRLVEKLPLGQAVEVTLDRPSLPFAGKVVEIVGEVDAQSRTQRVKIQLEGVQGDVLPGTFGRVWVADAPRPAILAPATAVYRVGQLEMVQVIQSGRAVSRLVKTGAVYGDRIEILAGLQAGDVILATPIQG